MTPDRIRVMLNVDPATHVVMRDGAVVDLGPGTAVDAGDGQARTLQEIVDAYAQAIDFVDISGDFPPSVQQAVGEVLYRALGADTFADGLCRWLEVVIDDGGAN